MMIRKISIGHRLNLGFSALLLLFAGLTLLTAVLASYQKQTLLAAMQRSTDQQMLAAEMKIALLETGSAMRGIGLQSQVEGMHVEQARMEAQRKLYSKAKDSLKALGLAEPEMAVLNAIAGNDRVIEAHAKDAVGKILAFDQEGAAVVIRNQIDPIQARSVAAADRLIALQRQQASALAQASAERDRRWTTLLTGMVLLILAGGVLLAVLITRSIVRPLRSAVAMAEAVAAGDLRVRQGSEGRDEVSSLIEALNAMSASLARTVGRVLQGTAAISTASIQIASGNADLSQRTEYQASSLEETAGTMEELAAALRQTASNASKVDALAREASSAAELGRSAVDQMLATMAAIEASSQRIVSIIDVINSISVQTNILSLNAAVEAARAGEQGAGFGVVAAEVRALSQRSAAAASEIRQLIQDASAHVKAGSVAAEDVGVKIVAVVSAIHEVGGIMRTVTAAAGTQSEGVASVNAAIQQMDDLTQQNAALVEQAAAAAESMKSQAGALNEAVQFFTVAGAAPASGQRLRLA